jgi:hypothetical protein
MQQKKGKYLNVGDSIVVYARRKNDKGLNDLTTVIHRRLPVVWKTARKKGQNFT